MADVTPDDYVATSLADLALAEQGCRRCPLYRNATQAVPGEGPRRAPVMLVGEQPGDQEDLQGHPFVGPAGGVPTTRWRRPASSAARSSLPTR
jgi:DNA polymerase